MQFTTRPDFDSVTRFLTWDRDRLDASLAGVEGRVAAGRMAEALAAHREFERALARRVRLEEDLVFTLFELRTGVVSGPTAVLRREHREIERALGLMREALLQQDAGAFADGLRFLRGILQEHNGKEERILYPTTDQLLSAEERRVLVARLQGGGHAAPMRHAG